jgi:hypothetical protein
MGRRQQHLPLGDTAAPVSVEPRTSLSGHLTLWAPYSITHAPPLLGRTGTEVERLITVANAMVAPAAAAEPPAAPSSSGSSPVANFSAPAADFGLANLTQLVKVRGACLALISGCLSARTVAACLATVCAAVLLARRGYPLA